MKLTVLGGSGAYPSAVQACSGYLVEHDGFRLLIDPGYATVPALMRLMDVADIDAVYVTHRHPDHCADLNPLLRARDLPDAACPRLPVYAPAGALDVVLALDRPGMLDAAYRLHEFTAGDRFEIGPFDAQTRLLPHFTPNAGLRLTADGVVFAYTGDTGPSDEVVGLGHDADLLLAEATYAEQVPEDSAAYLSSARIAGDQAAAAGAGQLLLTHLEPGTDHTATLEAVTGFSGPVGIATAGYTVTIGEAAR